MLLFFLILKLFISFLRQPDYEALKQHCNLWRNYDDIDDSFESVAKIMDYFSKNQDRIQPHGGPGHWNDPDMVHTYVQRFIKLYFYLIFYFYSPTSWYLVIMAWAMIRANCKWLFGLFWQRHWSCQMIWLQCDRKLKRYCKIGELQCNFNFLINYLMFFIFIFTSDVIAVNQDPLGIQGRRILIQKNIEVWARPIMPRNAAGYVFYWKKKYV